MRAEKEDYVSDIAAIRSMMERSSRFLSLAGWAGIMAGIYAIVGAYIAYFMLGFNPVTISYESADKIAPYFNLNTVMVLAITILIMSIGTAAILSGKRANSKGEKIRSATTRRLLINLTIPLFVGGLLILILISKGLIGLLAPFTLIFYGLAQYNASKFTFEEMRTLGLIEIVLGLAGTYFIEYGILLWALGFGVVHIVFGIYLHYKYEK
jgi:hypothetical protein